jgi:hypothetical protein
MIGLVPDLITFVPPANIFDKVASEELQLETIANAPHYVSRT